MHRPLLLCAVAGALALGAATAPANALPAQGLSIADHVRGSSVVDKAGWRWRYVGPHRYWWRRWRRY